VPTPYGDGHVEYAWRGAFTNDEVNRLHADAFGTRLFDASEWDWEHLTATHSLGWVVARADGRLVGFVNVLWDGLVHAWIQDVMVAADSRHRGIATAMVARVRTGATAAGCEWLHVDFDEELADLYLGSCGFARTGAGLMRLD
jgi:GNAT superfamily N-acetyltransferase